MNINHKQRQKWNSFAHQILWFSITAGLIIVNLRIFNIERFDSILGIQSFTLILLLTFSRTWQSNKSPFRFFTPEVKNE